jgi:hypothetical protein
MKRVMNASIVLAMVLLSLVSVSSVSAKTIKGVINISACKSGKYLYYSYNTNGTRDGIIRLNTETGKKTTLIRNSMSDSSWTNGYKNLVVKGKYIYAVWDKASETGSSLNYIYRISKDGKSKKKLGRGTDIAIVGNRIYYNKEKVNDDGEKYTATANRASMKLDGSDKRLEKKTTFSWDTPICLVYNPYEKKTVKQKTDGDYTYYSSKSGKRLIRKNNKNGEKKTIFKTSGKYRLWVIEIYDDMILVDCQNTDTYQERLYYVGNSGKGKVQLKEWNIKE